MVLDVRQQNLCDQEVSGGSSGQTTNSWTFIASNIASDMLSVIQVGKTLYGVYI